MTIDLSQFSTEELQAMLSNLEQQEQLKEAPLTPEQVKQQRLEELSTEELLQMGGIQRPEPSLTQQAFSGTGEITRDVLLPAATAPFDLFNTIGKGLESAVSTITDPIVGALGLPTSSQIEERMEEKFPGITKKSPTEFVEETFDDLTDGQFRVRKGDQTQFKKALKDISRDTLTLLNPLFPGKIGKLRAIGTSIAGVLGSDTLANLGIIDEGNKDLAKMGIWVASSMIRPGAMKKAAEGFYQRADNAIKDVVVTDNVVMTELGNLRENLNAVGGGALKMNKPAIEMTDGILKSFKDGTFDGKLIRQAVKNVNRAITESGGILSKEAGPLRQVRGVLQDLAERVGEGNPEFIKNFNEGNALWSANNLRNSVTRYTLDKIDRKFLQELSETSKWALGITKLAGKIVALPLRPIKKGIDLIENFSTNEAARRFYMKALEEISKNNAPAAKIAIQKMDEEFRKEEKS